MPTQTTTTTLHSKSTRLVSPPPLSEFEDKLFHWLIGVKCQNLRYLILSLYFNLLCHFQIHSCSLSSTSCYCLATRSYRSVCMFSLLSFSTYMHPTFYSKRHQQIVYSYTTFYQHTRVVRYYRYRVSSIGKVSGFFWYRYRSEYRGLSIEIRYRKYTR